MAADIKPKTVILCGGQGTRLKEQTEYMPKPLVPIGNMPILQHIMKGYSVQGFKDFVLCLGYKGNMIKDFFVHYKNHASDIEVDLGAGTVNQLTGHGEDWRVILADTGEASQTASRVKKVERYVNQSPYFLLTYGDGVGDVDFDRLIQSHEANQAKHGIACTVTGVHAHSKYGALKTDNEGIVQSFVEKPLLEDIINCGFMVVNREVLSHPLFNEDVALESVLEQLAKEKKLAVYKHPGCWYSMDTQRDYEALNELWRKEKGKAPWVTW